MSKVYFIKDATSDYDQLAEEALILLKKIETETNHQFAKEVPLKVHFGEKGNTTYIPAKCFDRVIDYLEEKNVSTAYIETNVLYRGARTTTDKHIETALNHGFTRVPIIIADGEIGTDYDEIEINKDYIDKCKIGKGYGKYNQFIIMAHFKGHASAGFGGACKQLAMGFAARGGKLDQHSGISPIVDEEQCIACGLCFRKCDYDAITMDGKAKINSEKCVGCAGCIAVCPEGAISNVWGGSNFLEKVAEYAYGAAKDKDNIYLCFVHNITQECDCVGLFMEPITENIGVFVSKDPVALDSACIDLIQKNAQEDLFESGRTTLRHAQKIGLGTMDYELIELENSIHN